MARFAVFWFGEAMSGWSLSEERRLYSDWVIKWFVTLDEEVDLKNANSKISFYGKIFSVNKRWLIILVFF